MGASAILQSDDFRPFAVNGLQKIRELLVLNKSDVKRENINVQAISILKAPCILATAVGSNRRVLTPLWFELLEEGKRDGSIQTEYAKELSELLPLINFWLMPSVFPASAEEICHKYRFIMKVLATMGLPYIVRNILGLSAKYYGAAESALAIAAILGSIAAGLLAGKMKIRKLSLVLAALGIFMISGGFAFLFFVNWRGNRQQKMKSEHIFHVKV